MDVTEKDLLSFFKQQIARKLIEELGVGPNTLRVGENCDPVLQFRANPPLWLWGIGSPTSDDDSGECFMVFQSPVSGHTTYMVFRWGQSLDTNLWFLESVWNRHLAFSFLLLWNLDVWFIWKVFQSTFFYFTILLLGEQKYTATTSIMKGQNKKNGCF